jgi:hypothetical protein
MGNMVRVSWRAACRSRSVSYSVSVSASSFGRCSSDSSAATTGTDREASFTQMTGPWYFRSTLTAVCAREVVAPPMSSGRSKPWRSISEARLTISSRDGVIRPESPMMSAPSSLAASRIFCAGTMTPRSTTS